MNHIASTGLLLFGLGSNLLPPHLHFQVVPQFPWGAIPLKVSMVAPAMVLSTSMRITISY
jgi:hypothetical protein